MSVRDEMGSEALRGAQKKKKEMGSEAWRGAQRKKKRNGFRREEHRFRREEWSTASWSKKERIKY